MQKHLLLFTYMSIFLAVFQILSHNPVRYAQVIESTENCLMGQLALLLLILDAIFCECQFPYLVIKCLFFGRIFSLDRKVECNRLSFGYGVASTSFALVEYLVNVVVNVFLDAESALVYLTKVVS